MVSEGGRERVMERSLVFTPETVSWIVLSVLSGETAVSEVVREE